MGFVGRVRDSLLALFGYPTKQRPEQVMDSIIATMSVRLRKCKGQVAIVLASQKRLQEQLNQNINMVTQYQVKALAAVGRGEDELARELLRKKKRYEDTVEKLRRDLAKHKRTSDGLMELVRRLELKLEETKRNKLLLLTQKECYETSQIIEEGFSGEDSELGFQDILESLEDDVNSLRYASEVGVEVETEALEHEEPLALPEGEDILDDAVDPKEALEDELEALRERLSANPELLEEAVNADILHVVDDEDDEEASDEDPSDTGIQILDTDGVAAASQHGATSVDHAEEDDEPPPPRRRKKASRPPEPAEEDDDEDGIIFIT